MSRFFLGAAGVAASAAIICNISPWLVAKPQLATLDYLNAAKLQTLDGTKTNFSVSRKLYTCIWTIFETVLILERL